MNDSESKGGCPTCRSSIMWLHNQSETGEQFSLCTDPHHGTKPGDIPDSIVESLRVLERALAQPRKEA